jgi:integrase
LAPGRRRQFSTRRTDKREALDIAQSAEMAFRRSRDRAHFFDLLGGYLSEVRADGSPVDFGSYAAGWLAVRCPEVSARTAEKYRQVCREILEVWGDRRIEDVTSADCAALRDRWGADHSVSTANVKLRILKAILADAWRDGAVSRNDAAKVRGLKRAADAGRRRPFSLEEIRVILAAADDEWRGMILLGLYTGQRLGDLARLTWGAVHLERMEIAFRTSKTGRMILLPIVAPLAEYLLAREAPDDPGAPLFPTFHGERRQTLSQAFWRLMASAGLVAKRESWKGARGKAPRKRAASVIGFHSLRHSTTSLLKAAGVSEAVAMAIVGHDSPAISRTYTSLSGDVLREALERLPKV